MNQVDLEKIVNRVLEEISKKNSLTAPNQTVEPSYLDQSDAFYFPEDKVGGVEQPNNREVLERAMALTPARIGIGRTGTRMKTTSYLQFRIDQAAAQDAVMRDVSESFVNQLGLPVLHTRARDMQEYLMNLDSGRKLSDESARWLEQNGERGKDVQIIVSDGLSTSAIESNIPDMLPAMLQGLSLKNISTAQPIFIKRGRVWVQDQVASITDCKVVVSLIGERPGLATAESLSAYMIYRPNELTVESDRTVISNIHHGGIPPVEAGAHLADVIEEILKYQASGVKYAQLRS